ncbi:alpha/beta hydrolase [Mycolicibacterium mucogenicum]|uniref:Alpha/beta hydrolase n=1 Tax=Mycolicibacterium mucogenicum TaxID=56689 RepID=A0A4R5WLB2_MYCMU|nr:alpha/beta hydrolase [Mycolicibacterium mucogenicum]TDK91758.1 alpha/beta hydrolase [Mycolicibacterium mucogenicum]
MTMSMPGDAVQSAATSHTELAVRPEHPVAGRPSRLRLAVLGKVGGVTLRILPKIPDRLKRLLLGGRRVTIDGNTLDTTLQLMLSGQNAVKAGGLVASSDVNVARAEITKLSQNLDSGIAATTTDITIPGPAGPLRARHYQPDVTGATPLLVFFHGGGFVVGGIESHDAPCRLICRDAGVQVVSVEYRLAPEHPAPAAADDCYATYLWCVENAARLGADPAKIAVGGDSAGGNLAAVVSQMARDRHAPLPAVQLLIYPVTNFASDTRSKVLFAEGYFLSKIDMDWFRANYLAESALDPSDPRVSPLLAEDLSGLPPALVLTGGFDPLRDEGDAYAAALAAAGVAVDHRTYGSLVHGFANFFPMGGDSATATADFVSAFRAHLTR